LFRDRTEAGRRLAARLAPLAGERPVVLALPRGGVPVGFEIARALGAPLDVVVVRKIGAPWQPELALGAIVGGDAIDLAVDEGLLARLRISREALEPIVAREREELHRRERLYRAGRPRAEVLDRTAIVVDDGVATGASMRAALRAIRRRRPRRLVLAVPVAPPETVTALGREVDELVCLEAPRDFFAVGQHYARFDQVSDEEVIEWLDRAAEGAEGA
jgi:putative phosphoribosyl transferase